MIYAIGDSFTAGGELEGCSWDTPGKGAWPEVLSGLMQKEVINKGRPACGNTRIVKRAIDAVLNGAEGIIICWTSISRKEFHDDIGIFDVWPNQEPKRWLIEETKHRAELIKYITKHEPYEIIYPYKNWLRQIILIQNLCKSYNVPCAMLIAFQARENYNACHEHAEVKKLINAIDKTIFVDNTINQSTVDWTFGLPKLPLGHPGIEGHRLIANKIYEHIRNLGWVS